MVNGKDVFYFVCFLMLFGTFVLYFYDNPINLSFIDDNSSFLMTYRYIIFIIFYSAIFMILWARFFFLPDADGLQLEMLKKKKLLFLFASILILISGIYILYQISPDNEITLVCGKLQKTNINCVYYGDCVKILFMDMENKGEISKFIYENIDNNVGNLTKFFYDCVKCESGKCVSGLYLMGD